MIDRVTEEPEDGQCDTASLRARLAEIEAEAEAVGRLIATSTDAARLSGLQAKLERSIAEARDVLARVEERGDRT